MIQDHFKAKTERKGWGGMSMGHDKRRRGGGKPGCTLFLGLLRDNFFQPKKVRQKQRCERRRETLSEDNERVGVGRGNAGEPVAPLCVDFGSGDDQKN